MGDRTDEHEYGVCGKAFRKNLQQVAFIGEEVCFEILTTPVKYARPQKSHSEVTFYSSVISLLYTIHNGPKSPG